MECPTPQTTMRLPGGVGMFEVKKNIYIYFLGGGLEVSELCKSGLEASDRTPAAISGIAKQIAGLPQRSS